MNTEKGNLLESNNNQWQDNVTGRCREMFSRFVEWMEDRAGRELDGGQAAAIAAGALVVAASMVGFAVWLVFEVVHLLQWVFGGQASSDIGQVLSELPVVQVATDPIGAWVVQHAAGLPVSAATLLTVWASGGAALALGGLLGSRGARLTWPAYGAATAAMAWFGASELHRPIAAGLIVLVWSLASILVLHRGGRGARTHITNVLPDRSRASRPSGEEKPTGAAKATPMTLPKIRNPQ